MSETPSDSARPLALVTGATGYIGGRLTPLVAHLAERDELTAQDIAEIEALLKDLKA